jgi:cell division protein FtsL
MEWFLIVTTCLIWFLLIFVAVMVWAIGEKVSSIEKKIDKKLR